MKPSLFVGIILICFGCLLSENETFSIALVIDRLDYKGHVEVAIFDTFEPKWVEGFENKIGASGLYKVSIKNAKPASYDDARGKNWRLYTLLKWGNFFVVEGDEKVFFPVVNKLTSNQTLTPYLETKIEDFNGLGFEGKIKGYHTLAVPTNNIEALWKQAEEKKKQAEEKGNRNDSKVETNSSKVETNSSKVETNSSQVETNSSQVETNSSQVETNSSQVETNASQVETNSSQVETNSSKVETNSSQVETNTSQVETNTSQVETNSSQVETNSSQVETNSTKQCFSNKTVSRILVLDVRKIKQGETSDVLADVAFWIIPDDWKDAPSAEVEKLRKEIDYAKQTNATLKEKSFAEEHDFWLFRLKHKGELWQR